MELFHRIIGFFSMLKISKRNCFTLDVVYFHEYDSNVHIVIVWWPLCHA